MTEEQKKLLENWKKELSEISIGYSTTEDGSNTDSMLIRDWDGGSLHEEIEALIKDLLEAARAEQRETDIETLKLMASEHPNDTGSLYLLEAVAKILNSQP